MSRIDWLRGVPMEFCEKSGLLDEFVRKSVGKFMDRFLEEVLEKHFEKSFRKILRFFREITLEFFG